MPAVSVAIFTLAWAGIASAQVPTPDEAASASMAAFKKTVVPFFAAHCNGGHASE